MSPGLLDHGVTVDVWQESQTEPVPLAGVREPVHGDAGLAGVEGLADPRGQLVVRDAAPKGGLAVHHRLRLQRGRRRARLRRGSAAAELR